MLIAMLLAAAQPVAIQRPENAVDITASVIALRDWVTCLDAEGARAAATGRNSGEGRGVFAACAAWEDAARTAVAVALGARRAEDLLSQARREWPGRFAGRARVGLGTLAGGAWSACVHGALASGNVQRAGRSDDAIVEAAFSRCAQQEGAFRATVAARGGEAAADAELQTVRSELLAEAAALFRRAAPAPQD